MATRNTVVSEYPCDILNPHKYPFSGYMPDYLRIAHDADASKEVIEALYNEKFNQKKAVAEVLAELDRQRDAGWNPTPSTDLASIRQGMVGLAAWCLLNIEAIDNDKR